MSSKKAPGRLVRITRQFSPTEAGELLHMPLSEEVVGESRNLQSGALKKRILSTPLWNQGSQERSHLPAEG